MGCSGREEEVAGSPGQSGWRWVQGGVCTYKAPCRHRTEREGCAWTLAAEPLALGPQGMGTPRVPTRTVLFRSERSGLTYRVPALLPVPPGPSLLAFAEQRRSPSDAHAHRLVQRRGALAGGSVQVSGLAGAGGCPYGGREGGARCGRDTEAAPPSPLLPPGSGAPPKCWTLRPWRSTGP